MYLSFRKRVKNYIELIKNRGVFSFDNKSINLFSNEVYNRYTMLRIYNKATLAEMWEYFLNNDKKEFYDLSDCIRIVYAIAAFMLKKTSIQMWFTKRVRTMDLSLY